MRSRFARPYYLSIELATSKTELQIIVRYIICVRRKTTLFEYFSQNHTTRRYYVFARTTVLPRSRQLFISGQRSLETLSYSMRYQITVNFVKGNAILARKKSKILQVNNPVIHVPLFYPSEISELNIFLDVWFYRPGTKI